MSEKKMSKKNNASFREEHSNKVYQALRYLDSSERKRLLKYLNSPYFNQSKILAKLGETLLAYIEKSRAGFDRKSVWQKIFPNEVYDDVNFRKACSDLLKQLEGFMAQETMAQDDTRRAIDTLDFITRKKIEPLYNSAIREARSTLSRNPYQSADYYRNGYLTERYYYTMMDFNVKLNMRANIEEISYNLDLFYWIEKLKFFSAALSHKKTGNYHYEINFINEIIQFLQHFPIEDIPYLAINYYSFMTIYEDENLEHYYNLRRMLDKYGGSILKQEAVELFDSALHYCTGKINKGNRDFLQEYFNLFEDAIKKGIFIQNGELAIWRFNNIVAAALRLGKLEWAEEFVENYKQALPLETRENTYTFNLARVYLYQKKFSSVLHLLRGLEYEDIFYNLISKVMLTITYYELEENDTLDSFLESFRVFLNRNKEVTQQYRILHLNLIKYTRRLTRILPGDKVAIEKLREEITREKSTTVNHEWLLEKLTELEK